MALCVDRAFWALSNAASNSSFQAMVSLAFPPAIISSSGAIRSDEFLMTLDRTLYEPIKDLSAVTVFGGWQLAKVAIRCGFAWIVPRCQCHPRIVASLGAMIVFEADRLRLHLCNAIRTLSQLFKSYPGV